MLRFFSFTSGSCGNCYYLTDGRGGLLVDAGVSLRRMKRVMGERGFTPFAFEAVLVTHDHLDHIRHLGSYCKHLGRPVYSTPVILDALSRHSFTMEYIGPYRRALVPGEPVRIPLSGGATPLVRPFIVPHDATQTVGYEIQWDGVRFVLMTDIGAMTPEALSYARTADAVVIESNYDLPMLLGGSYPQELKARIRSGNGHLSNAQCAQAVQDFWHPGLKHLFLCHLSENNNMPRLAFTSTEEALCSIALPQGGTARDVTSLQTLPRGIPSRVFTLETA